MHKTFSDKVKSMNEQRKNKHSNFVNSIIKRSSTDGKFELTDQAKTESEDATSSFFSSNMNAVSSGQQMSEQDPFSPAYKLKSNNKMSSSSSN
jgi:hypothetical protein